MGINDEQLYWAAVRMDFKTFMSRAFRTIYPNKDFLDTWHIDAIVHHPAGLHRWMCRARRAHMEVARRPGVVATR